MLKCNPTTKSTTCSPLSQEHAMCDIKGNSCRFWRSRRRTRRVHIASPSEAHNVSAIMRKLLQACPAGKASHLAHAIMYSWALAHAHEPLYSMFCLILHRKIQYLGREFPRKCSRLPFRQWFQVTRTNRNCSDGLKVRMRFDTGQ